MAVWGRAEVSGCRIVALSRRLFMGTRTDFWCSICRISSRFASHSARVISEFSATAMRRKARQACTQYDTLLVAPGGPATRRSPPHLANATFPGAAASVDSVSRED
jgi:hypothetical protein